MQDTAASVYTADQDQHANGTTTQTNRNLTRPRGRGPECANLDIETNDGERSHASTVGTIDEDQRFYLETGAARTRWSASSCSGSSEEAIAQLPVGPIARDLRLRVS